MSRSLWGRLDYQTVWARVSQRWTGSLAIAMPPP